MRQRSVERNGLWLESRDIDIEFLPSYTSTVYLYNGRLSDIGQEVGIRVQRLSEIVSLLRTCGWVHKIRNNLYALVREPNDEDYQKYKNRVAQFMQDNGRPSVRREVESHIVEVHARLDEVFLRLQSAEERIKFLEQGNVGRQY